jgi:putative membrane protein
VTWGTIKYPSPTFADDRVHSTMYGFISLLIVFRTSQAYARWWEARALWGSIVNSTRNLASNAACWMNDEARYTRAIICT